MGESSLPKPETQRRALLLGATGLVGQLCVRELLDSEIYAQVTVLTRRKIPLVHSRLRQILVPDFKDLDSVLAGIDAEDIFCCLGTTIKKAGSQEAFRQVDYGFPMLAARLMRRRGAKHFLVVSALGADSSSRFFYNRVKGDLERDLALLDYSYLTIFRPSLLSGERNEARLLEGVSNRVLDLVAPFMKGPLAQVRPIPAQKVAQAMVAQARLVADGLRHNKVQIVQSAAMQQESV